MIFQDKFIYIEKEENKLPWIKIFTNYPYKELSHCDDETRNRLLDVMMICEKTMLGFYSPEKINIASFGNYLQRVHIHVIARFKDDDFFPESVWGKKQRDSNINLPNFDDFCKILVAKLGQGFLVCKT